MIRMRKSMFALTTAIIVGITIVLVIAAVGIIPGLTAKHCKANPAGSSVCDGCEIPSRIPIDTYISRSRDGTWSPDCRYFAALDRHGSSLNPYDHFTVYKTDSWQQVCEAGAGDIMISYGPVGGYCELPLPDGQTWVVVGRDPANALSTQAEYVRFVVCRDPKTCINPNDISPLRR
jgi:hypothetical protein